MPRLRYVQFEDGEFGYLEEGQEASQPIVYEKQVPHDQSFIDFFKSSEVEERKKQIAFILNEYERI